MKLYRRRVMCLSSVFVSSDEGREVVVEEASQVRTNRNGGVEIDTLFGEKKQLSGYRIIEVNLLKNYIVLERGERVP
jgi:predicted RNA-binding protein